MEEPIPIVEETVRSYKGYFDIFNIRDKIQDYMSSSLKYKDYIEIENNTNKDNNEHEIETMVECNRMFSDYFQLCIKFVIEGKGKEEMVEVDGIKKKLVKGTLSLKVTGYSIADWQRKAQSGFLFFIRKIYEILTKNSEQDRVETTCRKDVEKLFQKAEESVF